ncbi:MAG: methyltransferase domain-containing protein [Polyangiales bacterium]
MSDAGQVTASAAEVYEEFFVPALFGPWAPRMVSAAELEPGMHVVDVACGTGVLAVEAAKAVSPGGAVVGVDLNPGMLAVARQKTRDVDWQEASAEALPFDDERFDAAVSQFGLMFFADQATAIGEMWRVLRPGGRLAIAVWDSLGNTPGYAAVVSLLARLFGDRIAGLLRSPYSLGDPDGLRVLFATAGVPAVEIDCVPGQARFPSIRSWMHTDVRGWTLADELDDAQYELLLAEGESELQRFVTEEGDVRFDHPAILVTARKN